MRHTVVLVTLLLVANLAKLVEMKHYHRVQRQVLAQKPMPKPAPIKVKSKVTRPTKPKPAPVRHRVRRRTEGKTRITVIEDAVFRLEHWPVPRSRRQATQYFGRNMHVVGTFPACYYARKLPGQPAIGPFVANGVMVKDGRCLPGRDLLVSYFDGMAELTADWQTIKPRVDEGTVEGTSLLGPKLPVEANVPPDWTAHKPTSWLAISHVGKKTILIERQNATFEELNHDPVMSKYQPNLLDSGSSITDGTYYYWAVGWPKKHSGP
jgi:hypothetical protein